MTEPVGVQPLPERRIAQPMFSGPCRNCAWTRDAFVMPDGAVRFALSSDGIAGGAEPGKCETCRAWETVLVNRWAGITESLYAALSEFVKTLDFFPTPSMLNRSAKNARRVLAEYEAQQEARDG